MINGQLPVDAIRQRFLERQRVRIESFLDESAALALHDCLDQQLPWDLVFRDGDKIVTLDETTLDSMTPQQTQEAQRRIQLQAQSAFQFVYWKFSMVDAYRRRFRPELIVHSLLEHLATASTIEMVRRITGIDDIRRVDAQATLYRPGNFLTVHDDEDAGEYTRRAAYVIQLSKGWKADWGGLLHFLGSDGDVLETFTPSFNSMTLFKVPQNHCVSMVASFSPKPRYAVTGWFTT